ncbi:caspase family protein [Streptomyces sp. NPDC056464]|uniref:wHTH domain-containing protein n=1 Tax=Streptomyces sp. NPDC056464 TaxID=3345828 RepID=UPI0036A26B95
MTIRRSALLVGVGATPRATTLFPSLDQVVEKDLAAMYTQVVASGYDVVTLGRPDDGPAGRNDITTALERAAATDCDLLLIYFTGHGVRVGDIDYLVPADAHAPAPGQEWSQAQLDSLLPVDVTSYLSGCRAPSVVYVVDACRDGGPDDEANAHWGASTVHAPSERLALFLGCGRKQRCHYDGEGSFFTRGFTEVLDPFTPERAFKGIVRRVKKRTSEYAQRANLQQTPSVSCAPADEELSAFPELCEGTEIPLRWRSAVERAPLWSTAPGDLGPDAAMRERIADFAHECAISVLKDRRRFDDPWEDRGLPTRTLSRVMKELLRGAPERSPLETGLLAALPFLREALWARKLSRLAEADPFDLDQVPADVGVAIRTELQYIHESHAQLLRKARGHARRGETEAFRALAAWLAHRWVAEQLVEPPDPGGAELIRQLARALLGPEQEHQADEVYWLLVKSLRFLFDDPMDADLYRRHLDQTPTALTTAEGRCPVRWWGVLGVVRLAGLLAADVRQFPDVLPDHVGVAAPVVPADVVQSLHDQLEWAVEGGHLDLQMLCPHPAVHEGILDLAQRADMVLQSLHGAQEQQRGDHVEGLPRRITTHGLVPARQKQTEERLYTVPLLRFALAQDEIRELLMGHQLYGDRSLAVRELYQNAADACRYRELRWRYHDDHKGGAPFAWNGQIKVTQGRTPTVDGRPGRAFIECRDNGVGMGRAQLEQTFSRAGRRFSQTRAFRQEQARWLSADPRLRLHPYSRFGIGVLSYFMIADEVTLVTREVHPDGRIARQALVVDISSSSGLFRIRVYEDEDDPVREGGTRVRLMLSEPEGDGEQVSALRVLSHQVRLSEYEFVLREEDGSPETRPAGELRHPAGNEVDPVKPLNARGPVWWVTGQGAVLADGIITSQQTVGYVVNLSGSHAPQLSVNRNSLLSWDQEWAAERIGQAAADLPGWEGLDLSWLWDLESHDAALARTVAAELAGRGLVLPVYRTSTFDWPEPSLDAIGCFVDDRGMLPRSADDRRNRFDERTAPWRLAVLRSQGLRVGDERSEDMVPPEDVTGYPVPRPGDSSLLDHAVGVGPELVEHAHRTKRSVAETLRDLRRFAILGRKVRIPAVTADRTPALDFVPEPGDDELVRWMHDWSDPSRAELRPPAAALLPLSVESGLTLGALLDRCRRYEPLGLRVPDVPLARLADLVATPKDVSLLVIGLEGNRRLPVNGLPRDVLPIHVARLADRLGLSGPQVLEELKAWEFLGYRLPAEEELLPSALSSTDWNLLHQLWNADTEEPGPSLQSVLAEAARQKTTAAELLESVGYVAEQVGARLPELHVPKDPLMALEAADLKLLTVDADDGAPLPTPGIPIDILALAHAPGGKLPGLGSDRDWEPWEMFVARVDRLAAFGMQVPEDLEPLRHWVGLPNRDRIAVLIGSLDPAIAWTAATVVLAAGELGESLDESLQRLATQADHLGKQAPALPAEALSLKPTEAETQLMLDLAGLDAGLPLRAEWIPITPFHLARYAHDSALTLGEALQRLTPYAALGAMLPDLTDEQRATVAPIAPEPYDLLALSTDMDLATPRPDQPVKPLELVVMAARIGRSVRAVQKMLSGYEAFGVVVDVPAAPDVVPVWRDLILLSEGLNGREPALHGAVSRDRAQALARELGSDHDWVTRRLEMYATMFELGVEPLDEEQPTAEGHPIVAATEEQTS